MFDKVSDTYCLKMIANLEPDMPAAGRKYKLAFFERATLDFVSPETK
jgi:hypothetical protein